MPHKINETLVTTNGHIFQPQNRDVDLVIIVYLFIKDYGVLFSAYIQNIRHSPNCGFVCGDTIGAELCNDKHSGSMKVNSKQKFVDIG